MAKLTTKARKKVPSEEFGEPGKRAYPMPDKAHAANAKARVAQMVKKGKLSKSEEKKIDAKANKNLAPKQSNYRSDTPTVRAISARTTSPPAATATATGFPPIVASQNISSHDLAMRDDLTPVRIQITAAKIARIGIGAFDAPIERVQRPSPASARTRGKS